MITLEDGNMNSIYICFGVIHMPNCRFDFFLVSLDFTSPELILLKYLLIKFLMIKIFGNDTNICKKGM